MITPHESEFHSKVTGLTSARLDILINQPKGFPPALVRTKAGRVAVILAIHEGNGAGSLVGKDLHYVNGQKTAVARMTRDEAVCLMKMLALSIADYDRIRADEPDAE